VAGDDVDLSLATVGISPTIIVASSGTMAKYHAKTSTTLSLASKFTRYFRKRTLQAGNLPSKRPTVALSTLSKLRLLLISQPDYQKSPLSSSLLSSLRLALGTRIGYSLTAGSVAGAVAQTNILDYRDKGHSICVGPAVSSVEISVTGDESAMGVPQPRGKVRITHPQPAM